MWGVTKPHFEGLQRVAQKVPQLFAKKKGYLSFITAA